MGWLHEIFKPFGDLFPQDILGPEDTPKKPRKK